MDRRQTLESLLNCMPSLQSALEAASTLPWDCEQPLTELKPAHIFSVLSAYLAGTVSAAQVEAWANAVESREDVGYEPASAVGLALHELANPVLERQLSRAVAKEWVARLEGSAT